MIEYTKIKELLKSMGYNRITEDIEINGELFYNFYDEDKKQGVNITIEKY